MQLQNFECQIAKAQIGRYIAGDTLSDEALLQLEHHIKQCETCKQNLAERRAVLQAMLSPGEVADVPSEPSSGKRGFDLAELIRSKLGANQRVEAAVQTAAPGPASFTKPAIYSLALGAVLIGMSYLSKNMTSVLGPKAADLTTVQPIAVPPVTAIVPQTPAPTPAVTPSAPEAHPNPFADASVNAASEVNASPVSRPGKIGSQAAAGPSKVSHIDHQPSAPKVKPKTAHRSQSDENTIRVYNPGN